MNRRYPVIGSSAYSNRTTIYYHGAPIRALPNILKNGLLTGVKTRYQDEEAPYGGLYFTKSWHYALEMSNGGNRKVGTRALLVVAAIDVRTAFLDEDIIPRIGSKLRRLERERAIEHYTEWLLDMVEDPHPKLAIRVQEITTQIVGIILDEARDLLSAKNVWQIELGNVTIRRLRDKLTRILEVVEGEGRAVAALEKR